MKRILFFLVLLTGFFTLSSQEFIWKADVNSFFDNMEFSKSNVQNSQTMAGVHVSPEVGVSWKKDHRLLVGVDVMHEFGSKDIIDYYDLIAYYEYDGKPFRFYMGAFPRKMVLDRYPRMFFQDSINNYRPTINGLFWELRSEKNYLNVWLDWTSRQTEERHEAFFMGWSGKYNLGIFYGQHFGYMFHFAGRMNVQEPVYDNGLTLTSLGVDLSHRWGFEKLEANVGWSVGLDRNRKLGGWHIAHGLLSEVKVEYKGLGLFNTYYRGNSQQYFYDVYSNELYWGDKIYRSKEYNRTDLYIQFFKTKVVNVKLMYSLHFTEQRLYNEQSLHASFNMDNFRKKDDKPYIYIWSNWF